MKQQFRIAAFAVLQLLPYALSAEQPDTRSLQQQSTRSNIPGTAGFPWEPSCSDWRCSSSPFTLNLTQVNQVSSGTQHCFEFKVQTCASDETCCNRMKNKGIDVIYLMSAPQCSGLTVDISINGKPFDSYMWQDSSIATSLKLYGLGIDSNKATSKMICITAPPPCAKLTKLCASGTGECVYAIGDATDPTCCSTCQLTQTLEIKVEEASEAPYQPYSPYLPMVLGQKGSGIPAEPLEPLFSLYSDPPETARSGSGDEPPLSEEPPLLYPFQPAQPQIFRDEPLAPVYPFLPAPPQPPGKEPLAPLYPFLLAPPQPLRNEPLAPLFPFLLAPPQPVGGTQYLKDPPASSPPPPGPPRSPRAPPPPPIPSFPVKLTLTSKKVVSYSDNDCRTLADLVNGVYLTGTELVMRCMAVTSTGVIMLTGTGRSEYDGLYSRQSVSVIAKVFGLTCGDTIMTPDFTAADCGLFATLSSVVYLNGTDYTGPGFTCTTFDANSAQVDVDLPTQGDILRAYANFNSSDCRLVIINFFNLKCGDYTEMESKCAELAMYDVPSLVKAATGFYLTGITPAQGFQCQAFVRTSNTVVAQLYTQSVTVHVVSTKFRLKPDDCSLAVKISNAQLLEGIPNYYDLFTPPDPGRDCSQLASLIDAVYLTGSETLLTTLFECHDYSTDGSGTTITVQATFFDSESANVFNVAFGDPVTASTVMSIFSLQCKDSYSSYSSCFPTIEPSECDLFTRLADALYLNSSIKVIGGNGFECLTPGAPILPLTIAMLPPDGSPPLDSSGNSIILKTTNTAMANSKLAVNLIEAVSIKSGTSGSVILTSKFAGQSVVDLAAGFLADNMAAYVTTANIPCGSTVLLRGITGGDVAYTCGLSGRPRDVPALCCMEPAPLQTCPSSTPAVFTIQMNAPDRDDFLDLRSFANAGAKLANAAGVRVSSRPSAFLAGDGVAVLQIVLECGLAAVDQLMAYTNDSNIIDALMLESHFPCGSYVTLKPAGSPGSAAPKYRCDPRGALNTYRSPALCCLPDMGVIFSPSNKLSAAITLGSQKDFDMFLQLFANRASAMIMFNMFGVDAAHPSSYARFEWEASPYSTFKATGLRKTKAQADGLTMCFQLASFCPSLTRFCYNDGKGGCRHSLFSQDADCCPTTTVWTQADAQNAPVVDDYPEDAWGILGETREEAEAANAQLASGAG
eukprot:gene28153-31254_t